MVLLFSAKHILSHAFFLCQLLLSPFLLHCSARDTVISNSSLSDNKGETLVSPEGKFELGFFTPNGSSGRRRYLGIWYYSSNPPVVVWIANRDNPLSSTDGIVTFGEDGNLKILDGNGRPCWSTNLEQSTSINKKAKLLDTGNMVVSENDGLEKIVWQSFDNPTDTFLPGMKMEQGMALTSWKSYYDPSSGNFTFELEQEANQFVIWKRSTRYWISENSSEDGISGGMPSALSYFLSNFTSSVSHNDSVPYITSSLYANTRMVMSFFGQIRYLKWDSQKIWSPVWEEPRTRCSLYNACGNFGSCNSYNELACKCLPGFQSSSPEFWISGDYSGGCTRRSPLCSDSTKSDTFLDLKRMKVANPDSQFKAEDEQECKMECLNNCRCQAFSFEEAQTAPNESEVGTCWIWLQDLSDLQEEYDGGRDLRVRVKVSDIEPISRSCGTCSTNIIPYPLSTGPGCGDPTYFNLYCNISTGQLSFEAQGRIYKVTRITPENHKIFLQMADMESCKAFNSSAKIWQLNRSSPFQVVRWCDSGGGTFPSEFSSAGSNEVEIIWNPPSEPTCSSAADCRDWPNSTCTIRGDGKRNCICNQHFQWDGLNLNCTREGHHNKQTNVSSTTNVSLPLVIMIASISVIAFVVLTSYIICMYLQRKKMAKVQGTRGIMHQHRRTTLSQSQKLVKDIIHSGRFNEDETKAIDVPHFDLESILPATKNFSNSNKLGQGGFGPVYKAKFAGGEEIAVKRLSSCSSQGMEEFKNEVVLIAKLQHRNLVRLLGYCIEGDEKILLYEYMPNKSLDFFIFDRKLCTRLDWEMRYNIIIGIARGLLYLHQDSRLRIIHRDLKTSNILLDEEMNPKISDFGLARIFGGKETAANTNRVVGTYGYIAPEYALDGLFSFKSDVFSFGVVVLEIISGKRNTGFYQAEQSLSLLGYAWNLRENKALELLDRTLCKTYNRDEFLKCLNVGLLCVQEDPGDRPTMFNVLSMLGSDTVVLPCPKQPAFVVRRCPSSKASTSSKPETCSQNGLTITLGDGR